MKVCEQCYKSLATASKLREILKKNLPRFDEFGGSISKSPEEDSNPHEISFVSVDPPSSSSGRQTRAIKRKQPESSSNDEPEKRLKIDSSESEDHKLLVKISSEVSEILENQRIQLSNNIIQLPEKSVKLKKSSSTISTPSTSAQSEQVLGKVKNFSFRPLQGTEPIAKFVKRLENDQEYYDLLLEKMKALPMIPIKGFLNPLTLKVSRLIFYCIDQTYFMEHCYWRKRSKPGQPKLFSFGVDGLRFVQLCAEAAEEDFKDVAGKFHYMINRKRVRNLAKYKNKEDGNGDEAEDDLSQMEIENFTISEAPDAYYEYEGVNVKYECD